ncbi:MULTISPECIES: hypothetical protein [Providencia]|uniref:Rho-GAP domain-containing protein n=1 Tax=Providencia rettgeri TaxID=587 RepID=A0A379FSJ4_PRORE|nr:MULTISPECIES: hypothetical protein [Providencia]QXB04545.1 hypothetical protein I6L80_14175 [Providencia rettgeri]SUC31735.1 Uncharacterised protein [Providencia rettgeri]
MSSTLIATNSQPKLQTNLFAQQPKPHSFLQRIKSVCNKILSHTLFIHHQRFKVSENPLYRPQDTNIISSKTTQSINNISKLTSNMVYPPKSPSEIELDKTTVTSQFNKNIRLINAQQNISDDERKMHHQLNELDKAIRLHPEFSSTKGLFRLCGKKEDMHFIFLHLSSNKPLTQKFIADNKISLPTITLAYKELLGQIMEKKQYATYFSNTSPDVALRDAYQNQQDIIAFMKKNRITDERETKILAKVKNRFDEVTPSPPLFNMLTSLLADIAKNPAINMNARSLAICLAPRLQTEQSIPFSKSLNDRMVTFLEALIHTKL